ncbi:hypothetical protein OZK63_00160, partial [Streptomyces sp. UMAF16]|nr:hypothetical protein [Streptomyces sp. UMAF16]
MSPRAGQSGPPARTLAFVESPVQLLNVLEWAHLHAGRIAAGAQEAPGAPDAEGAEGAGTGGADPAAAARPGGSDPATALLPGQAAVPVPALPAPALPAPAPPAPAALGAVPPQSRR